MGRPNKTVGLAHGAQDAQDAQVVRLRNAVGQALAGRRCVLAVSGGVDSMVLLDAAVATTPVPSLVVASFDHGTGSSATRAVAHVAREAARRGVRFVTGTMAEYADRTPDRPRGDGAEATWRHARWAFLRTVAAEIGVGEEGGEVQIATAHTQDDQIETVFMRALRDAGPRGLAALYAPSPVLRPLLDISRREIEKYAEMLKVKFVIDPSNASRVHLRNRVRHDLLPAIVRQRPGFATELLTLSHRAAEWRARMDAVAASFTLMTDVTGSLHIPRAQLGELTADALRALWPALAARGGVVMDWRGTHRLAAFTIEGEPGQSIQLSGGFEVVMRRESMVLRRWRRASAHARPRRVSRESRGARDARDEQSDAGR